MNKVVEVSIKRIFHGWDLKRGYSEVFMYRADMYDYSNILCFLYVHNLLSAIVKSDERFLSNAGILTDAFKELDYFLYPTDKLGVKEERRYAPSEKHFEFTYKCFMNGAPTPLYTTNCVMDIRIKEK